MLPRLPLPRAAACLVLAPISLSGACLGSGRGSAGPAEVPSVGAIPVAPMPAGPGVEPAGALVASSRPAPPGEGAFEASPDPAPAAPASEEVASPAPVAPVAAFPHVVLADELPYRRSPASSKGVEATDGTERGASSARRRHRATRPYHPEPGIVVDVAEAQGGASAADLQRAARNAGYWPFRRCYEEGLRRDQRLSGRLALDLDVSSSGAVERAAIASSSLGDESVALCVHREALHLAFSPAESATKAKLDVLLATGDEPVPVPRPLPNAGRLRDALRASWPAVEQCYVAELARRPDAGGRLELRFRANASGEITEVAEGAHGTDARFADVDITRCVLGVYRTTRLPSSGVCGPGNRSFYYAMHLEARP